MADVQKILDEIKETSKVKKMKSTFSRKMLTEVTEAMLNDVEYSINTYGLKGGKYNVEEVMPVKEVRKRLLGPILERTNMDKEDPVIVLGTKSGMGVSTSTGIIINNSSNITNGYCLSSTNMLGEFYNGLTENKGNLFINNFHTAL